MNTKPLAKSNGIVMQEVEDECLLYNLATNRAISLNRTAYFVWKNCDGKTEISEIAENLSREFNGKIEEDYVLLALGELQKSDLLEKGESFKGDKISRRKALMKYGMMAAMLPVVMGIVAPQAVHAQSCSGGVATCRVSGDCPAYPNPPRTCIDGTCNCLTFCTNNCCEYVLQCE